MTTLAFKDRVQERATNVGSSTLTLQGASATNLRTFNAAGLDGQTVAYVIQHRTTGQWEVGYGVYTAATSQLTRSVVLANSLGNTSLINFSSGIVDVWNDLPADKVVALEADSSALRLPGALRTTGAVTVDSGGVTVTAGGVTVVAGGVTVTAGTTAVQAFTATTVQASGAAVLQSTLNVTGAATFGSTVAIGGITYTFPASQSANRFLKTDGSGALSWALPTELLALADLSDVTITSVASGDVIRWNGSAWVNEAPTSANTASRVVVRDASGNFSAGTITAATGLAVTAGGVTVSAGTSALQAVTATTVTTTGAIVSGTSLSAAGNDEMIFAGRSRLSSPADGSFRVGTNAGAAVLTVSTSAVTFTQAVTGITTLATSSTATIGGALTVSSGGAAITGNSTVAGTFSATGAARFGALATVDATVTGTNLIVAATPPANDATASRGVFQSIGYGQGALFAAAAYAGVPNAPVAITSNFLMSSFRTSGYDGSAFAIGGTIDMRATEAWTSIAHGTQMQFHTTPNGSTTTAVALTLGQDKSATFAANATIATGLTVTAGGLTVSAGTTAVQALTATTGSFTGTITSTNSGALFNRNQSTTTGTYFRITDTNTDLVWGVNGAGGSRLWTGANDNAIVFGSNATVNDIQFVINTTPKLTIATTGAVTFTGGVSGITTFAVTDTMSSNKVGQVFTNTAATTSSKYIELGNTGCLVRLVAEASTGGNIVSGSGAYAAVISQTNAAPLEFATANNVRYSISSTGAHNFKSGTAAFGGAVTMGANAAINVTPSGGTTRAVLGDSSVAYIWFDVDSVGSRIGSGVGIGGAPPATGLTVHAGTSALQAVTATTIAATAKVSSTATTATGASFESAGATTNGRALHLSNTGGSVYMAIEASVGGAIFTGSTAYAAVFGHANSGNVELFANGKVATFAHTTGNATFSGTITAAGTTHRLGSAGGNLSVFIGASSPSADNSGNITFQVSNAATNWQIGVNNLTGSALTITPSTAGGGSTFSTPTFTLTTVGLTLRDATWSNARINSPSTGTIANTATTTIANSGSCGICIITETGSGECAIFALRGGNDSVMVYGTGVYSATLGTGSRINVGLSGGNYVLQNNSGSDKSFRVIFLGNG